MELFVIIVNFQPLAITTKSFILDVAAVLDPPLISGVIWQLFDLVLDHYEAYTAYGTNHCIKNEAANYL